MSLKFDMTYLLKIFENYVEFNFIILIINASQ